MAAKQKNTTRRPRVTGAQGYSFKTERRAAHGINRLKDDVYREMLRLESGRPGSELGLALSLLRAAVQRESLAESEEFQCWFVEICQRGLTMIEASLQQAALRVLARS